MEDDPVDHPNKHTHLFSKGDYHGIGNIAHHDPRITEEDVLERPDSPLMKSIAEMIARRFDGEFKGSCDLEGAVYRMVDNKVEEYLNEQLYKLKNSKIQEMIMDVVGCMMDDYIHDLKTIARTGDLKKLQEEVMNFKLNEPKYTEEEASELAYELLTDEDRRVLEAHHVGPAYYGG